MCYSVICKEQHWRKGQLICMYNPHRILTNCSSVAWEPLGSPKGSKTIWDLPSHWVMTCIVWLLQIFPIMITSLYKTLEIYIWKRNVLPVWKISLQHLMSESHQSPVLTIMPYTSDEWVSHQSPVLTIMPLNYTHLMSESVTSDQCSPLCH